MASKKPKKQKSNRPSVIEVLSYTERKNKRVYKKIIRKDPCSYCGKPIKSKTELHTTDHMVPRVALTEECSWDNFVSACQECNNRKANMSFTAFVAELVKEEKFLNYQGDEIVSTDI